MFWLEWIDMTLAEVLENDIFFKLPHGWIFNILESNIDFKWIRSYKNLGYLPGKITKRT